MDLQWAQLAIACSVLTHAQIPVSVGRAEIEGAYYNLRHMPYFRLFASINRNLH